MGEHDMSMVHDMFKIHKFEYVTCATCFLCMLYMSNSHVRIMML